MSTPSDDGQRPDWTGATDEALLCAVAERHDRAAFVELFGRYAGRIKAFLIKGGAPDGVAEDAAQEVMLALWRRAGLYDPEKAAAATWIFTIARNKRIDLARREVRGRIDTGDPLLFPEPVAAAEHGIAGAERDARVRLAIAALTEDQRTVVELAFFSDLSHGEIAGRLALPLGTVKSRLRLAFGRLKRDLGTEFVLELEDD